MAQISMELDQQGRLRIRTRLATALALKQRSHMKPTILAAISTIAVLIGGVAADADAHALVRAQGPAVVNCGAYGRPVVHYVWNGRTRMERITCVSTAHRVAPARRVVRHRSWKKSALVIGGATAAGAATGALVGGKKGALIGAAAGAGAGTVYEVHKRHKHHRRRLRG